MEKGLAKLVLTLIELIRQLLEKQAMRRMEAGSLSDDQIENLGLTLMKLEDQDEGIAGDLRTPRARTSTSTWAPWVTCYRIPP